MIVLLLNLFAQWVVLQEQLPNGDYRLYADNLNGQQIELALLDQRAERLPNGWLDLGNGQALDEAGTLRDVPTPPDNNFERRLFGPVWIDADLYLASGAGDNLVNIYEVQDGELVQLTDVAMLFPEAQAPFLSASAEFLHYRPVLGGFLYRARLRDAAGTDHNALYWFDGQSSQEMPFFGTHPYWSSDGERLVGSRLGESLYEIWLSDGEQPLFPGCNAQWSGDWLAYDGHDSAQDLNYTDCFTNGEVWAYNLVTEDQILLADANTQVVGWIGREE